MFEFTNEKVVKCIKPLRRHRHFGHVNGIEAGKFSDLPPAECLVKRPSIAPRKISAAHNRSQTRRPPWTTVKIGQKTPAGHLFGFNSAGLAIIEKNVVSRVHKSPSPLKNTTQVETYLSAPAGVKPKRKNPRSPPYRAPRYPAARDSGRRLARFSSRP